MSSDRITVGRTRRGLLPAIVAAALLVASACTASAPAAQSTPGAQSAPGAQATSTPQGTPKPDTLRYVSSTITPSLEPDPGTSAGVSAAVYQWLGGHLFRYDPSKGTEPVMGTPGKTITDLEPEMAQTVTMSADNLTMTIALRTAKSAAGNPLTADDVKWSFDRVVANNVTGANILRNTNFDLKNLVTVVNPQTVAIHFVKPSPAARMVLAETQYAIIDSVDAKKHATAADPWAKEWLALHSASFGAYSVESFETLKQVVLVANPNYWRGAAPIKKVTMRAISDPAGLVQLATTGEADYIAQLPYDQLKAIGAAGKMKIYSNVQTQTTILGVQPTRPRISDPRVRRAVSLAIDRTGIGTLYGGYATPLSGCAPTNLVVPAPDKPIAVTPQVAEAKALLAEAGYPNGFESSVTITPANPGTESAARIVQTNLAAIGIKLTIHTLATFAEFTAAQAKAVDDFYMRNPQSTVPDPGLYFQAYYSKNPGGSQNQYANAAYDAAVEGALGTPVGPQRDAYLKTLCNIMMTDVPVINIQSPQLVVALNPNLKGYRYWPNQSVRPALLSF